MITEITKEQAIKDGCDGKQVYAFYPDGDGVQVIDVGTEIKGLFPPDAEYLLVDFANSKDTQKITDAGNAEEEDTKDDKLKDDQKLKPAKSSVDVGKIKALHNAGWSETKIADEMGLTQPTIHYHLAKFQEVKKKL